MRKMLLLATLLLAACKADGGSDGYEFEKDSTLIQPQQAIVIKLYDNPGQIMDLYARQRGEKRDLVSEGLFGFTVYDHKTCTIFIVDPAIAYSPEKLGHEVTHCLYGNFHKTQDK